jgi:hypothetical protein
MVYHALHKNRVDIVTQVNSSMWRSRGLTYSFARDDTTAVTVEVRDALDAGLADVPLVRPLRQPRHK